jgi:hypothetical protein
VCKDSAARWTGEEVHTGDAVHMFKVLKEEMRERGLPLVVATVPHAIMLEQSKEGMRPQRFPRNHDLYYYCALED